MSMEVLARIAEGLGLPLDPHQLQRFAEYYRQLIAANRRISLTTITDYQEVQRRHFGESLAVGAALYRAGVLKPDQAARVLDLGAGAGFPGLPIRIVHPALRLTILEATRKKTAFLEHLLAALDLEDVAVLTGRAEAVAHEPGYREGYDLVLARAVAPLVVLVELALPFLEVGGFLATPKGSRARQEMAEAGRALETCGGSIVSAEPLSSPTLPLTLVLVEKMAPTPAAYPRRPGIPTKRPLR
jgi:16S rRNA (guanine527-N7)-methyltransferase